jgi:ribosomal-protein-alanine N-acetyltransferase
MTHAPRPSSSPSPEGKGRGEGKGEGGQGHEPEPLTVHVVAMRRRHVRSVVRIEESVYPRPWSSSLFLSELALRSTRAYFVARVGRDVVGYAGLMMTADDGHVTTIAVDPRWQRHRIATRLMLALAREALARRAKNLTLEVRLSNLGAQHLYRRFGFAPVGVRKNYYQFPAHDHLPEDAQRGPGTGEKAGEKLVNEDALVMWAHDVDGDDYLSLLGSIERTIPGETLFEERRS